MIYFRLKIYSKKFYIDSHSFHYDQMSQTSKQDKPSYTFKPTIPQLQGIPDSQGEIKNFSAPISLPQIKVPGRIGKNKPGEKVVDLGLPSNVDQPSFLYVHLTETDYSEECRKVYCIPGDSGRGAGGGEPKPADGGTLDYPTKKPDEYPTKKPDEYPTNPPDQDYPQDIPKPPREGRCKFYPKDPSGDPRKGGDWYYPDPDPKKGGEWIPQPPLDRAKIYVSDPIALDLESMENRFYRADLEIYGLEHGGASYEGRVFINNRNANQETPKTAENGYAGSFYVFGHGGCFGDPGHCDVSEHRREYDLRLSHPLTRMFTR